MKPDQYIQQLLIEHDCVIVPDFGGFLGNYGPATIDPLQHRLLPPHKEISFNRHLVKNDGLLAHYIATSQSTGYQEALQLIRATVTDWEKRLGQNERVTVEGVGTLFFDRNRYLRFEPTRSSNLLVDAFGLSPFTALPVPKAPAKPVVAIPDPIPAPAPKVVPMAAAAKRPTRKKPKARYILYGAAAAAFIGYLALIPVRTGFWNDTDFAVSDLNIFTEVCPSYEGRQARPELVEAYTTPDSSPEFPASSELHFKKVSFHEPGDPDFPNGGEVTVKLMDTPTVVPIQEEGIPADFRFHVIGGCFSEKENADRMVSDLRKKGFGSNILDQRGGLWRVTIQSYPSRTKALDGLKMIQEDVAKGAWMLVK